MIEPQKQGPFLVAWPNLWVSPLLFISKADRALAWLASGLVRVCSANPRIWGQASRLYQARRPGRIQPGGRIGQAARRRPGGGDSLTQAMPLLYGLRLTENIVNRVIGSPLGLVIPWRGVWLFGVEVQSAIKMRQAGKGCFLRLFDRLPFPLKKFLKFAAGSKYKEVRSRGGYVGSCCLTLKKHAQAGRRIFPSSRTKNVWPGQKMSGQDKKCPHMIDD